MDTRRRDDTPPLQRHSEHTSSPATRAGTLLPITVIDNHPHDALALVALLNGHFSGTAFTRADAALEGMSLAPPALIVVDELVAPGGAYDFVSAIRRDPVLGHIPVVIVSALDIMVVRDSILHCGGNGYLSKPWHLGTVLRTLSGVLNRAVEKRWDALPETPRAALKGTLKAMNAIPEAIAKGTPFNYKEFRKSCVPLVKMVYEGNIKTVMDAVKEHDNYTFAHSFKVATMLSLFGKAIGLPDKDQLLLASGGLLHDVGKMTIPLEVLNKPARLLPDEWEIMKSHVPTTLTFLASCEDLPKGTLIIAGQHHEKLDGSGYPQGLKGGEINELARMAAIVDVYGALTDRRSYKPSMEPEDAFGIMTRHMASHLDMGLVSVFRAVVLDQVR